ncbi:hypothetical protein BH20ACT13_BH20ACT13_13490 [soil metagenome]
MTSQGSAHGRFRRAVERRQVVQAETVARELGFLSLENALALVILYAGEESPKFDAAAVRWLARLALEGRDVRRVDVQLASAALLSLRGLRRERAEKTLLGLL